MIETPKEFFELLENLKTKNKSSELSKHLKSKLEAFQEVENLIIVLSAYNGYA